MDVERAAKQVGKAEDVVHLIGVVAAPGGDDGILAHGVGLFRGDFGVGVRHGKDHRVWRHGLHHFWRHRALGRDTKEDVAILHRVGQAARVGHGGMGRFPLVHALGATLIDHALGVAHDAIVVFRAHRLEQFKAGDASGPCPVEDDLDLADLFPRQVQRVDQAGGTDHGSAVLVVVKDRDVHLLFERLFDDETLGRLDVFEVDAAECRPHQAHGLDEFLRVFGVEFDVDRVHIGEAFEQDRLALHHRFRP